jgi:serine/threonine-protein kinase
MSDQNTKRCSTCGSLFSEAQSFCPHDGQPLLPVGELLGEILDGRYRIDGIIGAGGMGVVYRARHIHLDSEFAIKVLTGDLVSNKSAVERFRREAKAAGRINHPNAIKVTDFGVTENRIFYLVMEIVNGKNLRDLVQAAGRFDFHRTIAIAYQICGAVEAAHQSGVIHRDLKPDNILIEQEGPLEKVKVLDFGIAKLREMDSTPLAPNITQADMLIGTPHYMSPEQCQRKPLDTRSDIYSLGIILYEMLSGDVPFDSDTPIEVIFKQMNQTPRPLLDVVPDVPPPIAAVVMRALEKDPERRQDSAAQLATELREAYRAADGATSRLSTQVIPDADFVLKALSQNRNSQEAELRNRIPVPTDERAPISRGAASTVVSSAPAATGENKINASSQAAAPAGFPKPLLAIIALLALSGIALLAWMLLRPTTTITTQPPQRPIPPGILIPENMVQISGGTFTMGRQDGDEDERPTRSVQVKSFYLDKYEVTNQDYKKFVDAAGRAAPSHWKNGSFDPAEASFPVTHVTWQDASDYAAWARKRLPTEAEWEYAARSGKDYLYPWGREWKEGFAYVNQTKNKPASVVGFENDRNEAGVFNLAGNVSEWVADSFSFYDGRPLTSCQGCRVYRGGNFADTREAATATHRFYDYPDRPARQTLEIIGFRCAMDDPKMN